VGTLGGAGVGPPLLLSWVTLKRFHQPTHNPKTLFSTAKTPQITTEGLNRSVWSSINAGKGDFNRYAESGQLMVDRTRHLGEWRGGEGAGRV